MALIAGNVAAGSPVPDDQRSRLALLEVLGHATRAELTERNVRVQVITDGHEDVDILNFLFDHKPLGARIGRRHTAIRQGVPGLAHRDDETRASA